jgi:RNA polymerase sigma factor (TIGR02999 family)
MESAGWRQGSGQGGGGGEATVTLLLQRWSDGEREAAARVLPLIYRELRRIAARELRRERAGHTLQATAVVHEAFLSLEAAEGCRWLSRDHFFAFAAHLMRRVLVDHARRRKRTKRGGAASHVPLSEVEAAGLAFDRSPDLVALDDALSALQTLDARKAAVVELRFFGGLSLDETAAALGISVETVGREWRRAKAWLYGELCAERPGR